jgi:hypothetical protein
MQDGTEHVHRIVGMIGVGETPAMCLAVDGDTDTAARVVGGAGRSETGGAGDREGEGIELAKQAMQGGLVRRDTGAETEGGEHRRRLALAELGDGEEGEVVGEQGDDGEGDERGEGEAASLRTTRVGKGGEGGDEVGRRLLHRALLADGWT